MFIGEFVKELFQARRTRRAGIRPQMHRGLKYAGMRAASNVFLRDVNTSLIIVEMYRGANVIYADFTDYDEIAHHSGPSGSRRSRRSTASTARSATLVKAAEGAPRPYKFIVLSDHGQSLGATFLQRYGKTLGEVVRDLMGGRATVVESEVRAEGSTFVNSFLSEVTRAGGVSGAAARAAFASRTEDGVGRPRPGGRCRRPPTRRRSRSSGPGNLGLVYFTGYEHRLTLEELEEKHPGLVAKLPGTRASAILMVRSATRGAVVLGHNGVRYLDEDGPDAIEGEDPTAAVRAAHRGQPPPRGRDAPRPGPPGAQPVRPGAGRGRRVRGADRLARRAGRLPDPAVHPPSGEWELDEPVPLGAPAIYRNLRRWLSSIGIDLAKTRRRSWSRSPAAAEPESRLPQPASGRPRRTRRSDDRRGEARLAPGLERCGCHGRIGRSVGFEPRTYPSGRDPFRLLVAAPRDGGRFHHRVSGGRVQVSAFVRTMAARSRSGGCCSARRDPGRRGGQSRCAVSGEVRARHRAPREPGTRSGACGSGMVLIAAAVGGYVVLENAESSPPPGRSSAWHRWP